MVEILDWGISEIEKIEIVPSNCSQTRSPLKYTLKVKTENKRNS